MSLVTFITPLLPPGTPPPLLPLNANTHVGILPASASSNLMRLQNANIDNLINGCFKMLPEIDAFGNGKNLVESGLADQTNSAPLFPRSLSMTRSPAEADGTAEVTVSEGAEGKSILPTSLSSTQCAHNSHITSNTYFFLVLTT
jgi:hypothetical protein